MQRKCDAITQNQNVTAFPQPSLMPQRETKKSSTPHKSRLSHLIQKIYRVPPYRTTTVSIAPQIQIKHFRQKNKTPSSSQQVVTPVYSYMTLLLQPLHCTPRGRNEVSKRTPARNCTLKKSYRSNVYPTCRPNNEQRQETFMKLIEFTHHSR